MKFIQLSKKQLNLIKWLKEFVNDEHTSLKAIHMDAAKNQIFAANGFVIVSAQLDDEIKKSLDEKMIVLETCKFGTVIDDGTPVSKPPEWDALIPDQSKKVFSIAVDPNLLIEALKGFAPRTALTINFYGDKQPFELTGVNNDSVNCYALIMPMHKEQSPIDKDWRPS